MNVLLGLVLAALVLVTINVQRAYAAISVRELKHRARQKDEVAELLHRAASYGYSLRAILWLMIGLASAGFFVYVSKQAPTWLALLASALLVWGSFVRASNRKVSRLSLQMASKLAPIFSWLLIYLHPVIDGVMRLVNKYHPITIHTGLYDKQDLLELLNNQNVQADNRIEQYELELAFHALTFGDKQVGDYLTPRRIVKVVSIDDSIGPVMMNELHDSGFSRFPVYAERKDNIVGTLFLRDLIKSKSTGKVKDIMRPEVAYVHEDHTLHDALTAILKTRQHILIVVNSFEEFVGVISIEDILEQVIGRNIQDEFDQYDDLRAVAARAAKKEHKEHQETVPSVETEEAVIE